MKRLWKQPTPLADTLQALLKKKPYGKLLKQQKLFEDWAELVGDALAEKTTPQKIRQNTLWVGVNHPAWIQELQFLKDPLLTKLKNRYPNSGIQKIRFVLK